MKGKSSLDINNVQIGGRTAVDGDFTSNQAGLATDVACHDPAAANLIVSGDVQAFQTQLQYGSAYVSDKSVESAPFFGQQGQPSFLSPLSFSHAEWSPFFLFSYGTGGRLVKGDIKANTGVDLDAVSSTVNYLRNDICFNKRKAIPANVRPFGAIWFNSDSSDREQYFDLNASDLNTANLLKFNIRNKDTAVIVVVKGDVPVTFGNLGVENGCTDASRILFVFCSDCQVTLSNLQLEGSVLAKDLVIKDASIVGTVAAQNLQTERANFKPAPFCS